MNLHRKRKANSGSAFTSEPADKTIVIDHSSTHESSSTAVEAPIGKPTANDCQSKSGLTRERPRKDSSRLFSFLRFRSSGTNKATFSGADKSSVGASHRNLSEPSYSAPTVNVIAAPEEPMTGVTSNQIDHVTYQFEARLEGEASDQCSGQRLDQLTESGQIAGTGQFHADPELLALFSSKLLNAPGQSTVIHRVHLQSARPDLWTIHAETFRKQGDSANDSSNISSFLDEGASSPLCHRSTLLTSYGQSTSLPSLKPSCRHNLYEPTGIPSLAQPFSSPFNLPEASSEFSPSIATVEAVAATKIYLESNYNALFSNPSLRSQRFRQLEEHIRSFHLSMEEELRVRSTWVTQESNYLRRWRNLKTRSNSARYVNADSIAGYEVIKVLGRGSFGVVSLVREKYPSQSNALPRWHIRRSALDSKMRPLRANKEVYAMKAIRKSAMIRNSQEGHVKAERDFLVAAENSRWIVQLISSFQDHHFLYLVLEYMVGGDFLSYLIRKDILSEEETRHYVAQMILCVEETHRLRWIHRDIKPDNFLISASGHLKIADFGLAFDGHWTHDQAYLDNHRWSLIKKLGIRVDGDSYDQTREPAKTQESRVFKSMEGESELLPPANLIGWRNRNNTRRFARSVVGTSQYMAPEVVTGDLYDGRCDYWSIGIILYECLYGFTPFTCEDRKITKLKIWQHHQHLFFPRSKTSDRQVPLCAIDLITRLLQDKERRLCCRTYRVNDFLRTNYKKHHFYFINDQNKDYRGNFVFPNDAAEIKAHPFFKDVQWDKLHLQNPPFVPKVKGWKDTRFFDDGGYMDDADLDSTDSNRAEEAHQDGDINAESPERECADAKPTYTASRLEAGAQCGVRAQDMKDVNEVQHQKRKEKVRARDKILRDERVGKTALSIRKRTAFLGYTYLRAKCPAKALNAQRGRPRGLISDLYYGS